MKAKRLVMSMFVVALIALMPALAGAEVLNLAPASSRVLPGMSAESLISQLANARLEVRYSFLIW